MNEKIDNTLNIALNLPEEDLEKSQELSVGIENDIWELMLSRICDVFEAPASTVLTDRYLNGIPKDSRVNTDGRFLQAASLTEERMNKVRALNEIAKERNQTLAEMALSWILKDGIVTTVLAGASKTSQILDNIKAVENTDFSDEEIKKINDIAL